MDTFQQILELDEDDNLDFSMGMVEAYFQQANATFKDMDTALYAQRFALRACLESPSLIFPSAAKDLAKLSSLGHFLKGSSAALGVHKVHGSCERMQNYGSLQEEDGGPKLSPAVALEKLTGLLAQVKVQYTEAEAWLRAFYNKQGCPLPT